MVKFSLKFILYIYLKKERVSLSERKKYLLLLCIFTLGFTILHYVISTKNWLHMLKETAKYTL